MQTDPGLPTEWLLERVSAIWGLPAREIRFLPMGTAGAAMYRVAAGATYFLKLNGRASAASEAAGLAVAVPRFLAGQGIAQVIPAIETTGGELSTQLDGYAATLYPFVDGRNGFECELSDRQWVDFGAALQAVHSVRLPPALAAGIPAETYPPVWREATTRYLAAAGRDEPADPVAAELAELLLRRAERIRRLVERAGRLAAVLRGRAVPLVLCHSDIHAGNLLISRDGRLYLVDWEEPVRAPKERDLMFVGAGIGGTWDTPREAELFYQGYGPVAVDPVIVAYYRYERLVQDVAAFCREIFGAEGSLADRRRALGHLAGGFEPGSVVDIAERAGDAVESTVDSR